MDEQINPSQPQQGGKQKKGAGPALIIVLVLIVAAGLIVYAMTRPASDDASVAGDTNMSEDSMMEDDTTMEEDDAMMDEGDSMMNKTYTLAEVAQHDSADDCWLAIEGKVYDVSAFIASGNHGGGDAILEGCGLDATELYNTRPMGSGTPHSDRARGFLPNFEIGELAQ